MSNICIAGAEQYNQWRNALETSVNASERNELITKMTEARVGNTLFHLNEGLRGCLTLDGWNSQRSCILSSANRADDETHDLYYAMRDIPSADWDALAAIGGEGHRLLWGNAHSAWIDTLVIFESDDFSTNINENVLVLGMMTVVGVQAGLRGAIFVGSKILSGIFGGALGLGAGVASTNIISYSYAKYSNEGIHDIGPCPTEEDI